MSWFATAMFDYLDVVPHAIFIRRDQEIWWANAAAVSLIGYSNAELAGTTFVDLIAPAWRSLLPAPGLPGELQVITAQGDTAWVEMTSSTINWENQPLELITLNDIRERKALEVALTQRESLYRRAIEAGLDGFYLLQSQHDETGKIADFIFADMNAQGEAMLPFAREEVIGQRLCELMPFNRTLGIFDQFVEVAESGEVLDQDFELPLSEDMYRWYHHQVVPIDNGIAIFIRDITERKAIENALRESRERYRIISELISDYAFAFGVEPDGTLIHEWITESFTRITGFTYTELDLRGQYSLFHSEDKARAHDDVRRVIQGEAVSGEYRIVTKEGKTRCIHIFRQPVWDQEKQRVIRFYGVAQDITARKQSEDELRKSEEMYRLIAENASDMITTSDAVTGIVTYISSACHSLLGYEPEEIIGSPVMSLLHPDEYQDIYAFFAVLQQSLTPMTITCRALHKSGDYGWFEITAKGIRDPDSGEAKEYITVSRDITARKEMETILLEQERLRLDLLKEQELNEVKSSLMRTISHEFRTPLSMILTATDFLDRYIEHLDVEARNERLQSIRIQVKRLSDMLDDISFVVQGTLHHMTARPALTKLEALCHSILDEIQTTIGKNHHFVFSTDGQLQEGIADKAIILRIMGNLLSNAVKYSPENSAISVSLYRENNDAVLRVSDQGIGIAEEEQRHIFEPFYRSSSVIDQIGGTGLGLSIVKDCVDLHTGTISVESELGKGTTFIVRLPQKLPT
jgi:PAS domain S-box-containing protein